MLAVVAESVSMSTVTSALVDGLTGIANNCMSAIGSTLPVTLPIAGAIIIVGVGFKIFKKVAK